MRRAVALVALFACRADEVDPPLTPRAPTPPAVATAAPPVCAQDRPTVVRFYDVGQGLAALVELPDGRRILVDAGDDPARGEACHGACEGWHGRLMRGLARDVPDGRIDLVWITHQHADHLGGAVDVIDKMRVLHLVDNGQEPNKAEVRRLHATAAAHGVPVTSVGPGSSTLPIPDGASFTLRAVVPARWPVDCAHEPNDCSIGLLVRDCRASALFVGDAERAEEALLDVGPVTLLQVGHHGSDTSTTAAFLDKTRPRLAVISSGKPDEGTNVGYCHPRRAVVERLDHALGGPKGQAVDAHQGPCAKPDERSRWSAVPASARLWSTARDGDLAFESALTPSGSGDFRPLSR